MNARTGDALLLAEQEAHMRTVQNTSPTHPWNRVIRIILADMMSSVDML